MKAAALLEKLTTKLLLFKIVSMRKTKERGSFHTFTEAKRDLSSSKKEVNDTESFTTEQCAQALLSAARAQGTDSPTTTTHFQNRASFIDSCTKIPKVGASLILQ